MEGRLYSGALGNAAAIGSLPFEDKDDGNYKQLISAASLVSLTDALSANDLPYQLAFERGDITPTAEEILQSWSEEAGRALAYAALSGQAFLDIHEVIIDGSLSSDLRERVVQETKAALDLFDRRGLPDISIREGKAGFPARAQGAAILPFQIAFDSENGPTS